MSSPTQQEIAQLKYAIDSLKKSLSCLLKESNPVLIPISKTATLTSSLVALPSLAASYITLINNENNLSLTINGGDEITLISGQIQDIPYITNTNQISVKGDGVLSYIVYTS